VGQLALDAKGSQAQARRMNLEEKQFSFNRALSLSAGVSSRPTAPPMINFG